MSEYGRHERQTTRERSGRYDRGPVCELCGKPAGWDYCSSGWGQPLVVCARRACQARLGRITAAENVARAAVDWRAIA